MNLCHASLGVLVHTSSVMTDGFEARNLIENDKGFMVAHFVKPPVNVTFTFPLKIELKDIFIYPCVGRQRSIDFEIFSSCFVMQKETSRKTTETSNSLCDPLQDAVFWSLAKGFDKLAKANYFHFENARYRKRFDVEDDPPFWAFDGVREHRYLRQTNSVALNGLTHLCVRINRAKGGCVPCIGKIVIRGQPARSCSKNKQTTFLEKVRSLELKVQDNTPSLFGSQAKEELQKPVDKGNEFLKLANNERLTRKSEDNKNYPQEFLDPLTWELMPMPVTLPSGHTVDQTTLDRFFAAEEKWGRPPSDPFTGKTFTHHMKPVPNVKLKARIDKFLLKLGREVDHLPRAVGRRDTTCIEDKLGGSLAINAITPNSLNSEVLANGDNKGEYNQFKELSNEKTDANAHQFSSTSSKESHANISKSTLFPILSKPQKSVNSKIAKKGIRITTKRKFEEEEPSPCSNSDRVKCPKTVTPEQYQSLNSDVSHEKKLSDSLDKALQQTLGGMASFRQHTTKELSLSQRITKGIQQDQQPQCTSCMDSGTKQLYQLRCQHHICRKCLPKTKRPERKYCCPSCQVSSTSSEIKRIHPQ